MHSDNVQIAQKDHWMQLKPKSFTLMSSHYIQLTCAKRKRTGYTVPVLPLQEQVRVYYNCVMGS